jgi:peptide/nickel transport system ATP-binding protein
VGIPDPERRAGEYPFQFSGGMLQRAMIAMAVACEPELLIADEPTTALDVTIQAQILDLMSELQESQGTSILLITHDLGVVSDVAADVAIMYAGRIVERGSVTEVLGDPQHPYTRALLASMPTLEDDKSRPLATIEGTVPGLWSMPVGCRFHSRCPHTQDLCRRESPPLETSEAGQEVACHLVAGRIDE